MVERSLERGLILYRAGGSQAENGGLQRSAGRLEGAEHIRLNPDTGQIRCFSLTPGKKPVAEIPEDSLTETITPCFGVIVFVCHGMPL